MRDQLIRIYILTKCAKFWHIRFKMVYNIVSLQAISYNLKLKPLKLVIKVNFRAKYSRLVPKIKRKNCTLYLVHYAILPLVNTIYCSEWLFCSIFYNRCYILF